MKIIATLLCDFKWYRRWRRGVWCLVRLDLGDRPIFWTQDDLANVTILEMEDYDKN